MSHTNSTTNYSLPQFVTSDKPAWLTDINTAFAAIDTGMNNAQTKANTADSNATQALSDASDAATAASAADAKGAGAVASIADTFQATETYEVGDLVIYNNLLYVCSTAVTDPGAWTGSTNWTRVTVESFVNGKTASDIPLNSSVGAPTIANAIAGKAAAPIIYTPTTDTVTITASTSLDVCRVYVQRRWIPYNASLEILAGLSSSDAQVIEVYKGSNVTVTKTSGQTFTINEEGLNGARIIIEPIFGSWSIASNT